MAAAVNMDTRFDYNDAEVVAKAYFSEETVLLVSWEIVRKETAQVLDSNDRKLKTNSHKSQFSREEEDEM